MMKNTLKYVLIVVGFLLTGYGLYSLFRPDILTYTGALHVEEEQRQSLAILGLGILALLAGLSFARK